MRLFSILIALGSLVLATGAQTHEGGKDEIVRHVDALIDELARTSP